MATGTTIDIDKELLELLERPKRNRKGAVVTKGKDDEPVMEPIPADEILSFREYPDSVAVVTADGRKFSAPIPAKLQKARAAAAAKAAEKPADQDTGNAPGASNAGG